MSKYQIIRMKNGRQQHFDTKIQEFRSSQDRWDGEFEGDYIFASKMTTRANERTRPSRTTTKPKLHIIEE